MVSFFMMGQKHHMTLVEFNVTLVFETDASILTNGDRQAKLRAHEGYAWASTWKKITGQGRYNAQLSQGQLDSRPYSLSYSQVAFRFHS